MADMIRVKCASDEGNAQFWERHPDHPNGEVFVDPGETVEVALTSAVGDAIHAGRLMDVSGKFGKDADEPVPTRASADAIPRSVRRGE